MLKLPCHMGRLDAWLSSSGYVSYTGKENVGTGWVPWVGYGLYLGKNQPIMGWVWL